MSPINLDQLLQHEAFRGLSEPAQQRLREGMELLSFELGEQLVEAGVIPGRVLILLEGRARLVGNDQGRLISLGKFDPGAVLGAASLLCGRNCENLIASDAITAASLSDDLWAELYGQEETFRDWCDRQLWSQEIITLLQDLQQGNRTEGTSSTTAGQFAGRSAGAPQPRRHPGCPERTTPGVRGVDMEWQHARPALQEGEVPPKSQPFPARLISLPSALVESSSAELTTILAQPMPHRLLWCRPHPSTMASARNQAGPPPSAALIRAEMLDQLA